MRKLDQLLKFFKCYEQNRHYHIIYPYIRIRHKIKLPIVLPTNETPVAKHYHALRKIQAACDIVNVFFDRKYFNNIS